MRSTFIALLFGASLVVPLSADVTITSTVTTVNPMASRPPGQSTTMIKGGKLRTDNGDTSIIVDATTGTMTMLNHRAKEVQVRNLADLQAQAEKSPVGASMADAKVKVTPTGKTRQLLGRSCDEYELSITVPMKMGGAEMSMAMTSMVYIAKGAPGSSDYAAFYKAATAHGTLFTEPQQQNGAMGGAGKAMSEAMRLMAEAGGIPYLQEMKIQMQGTGQMAGMMNQMGGVTVTTTVTAVSTDPISDSHFTAPSDYKTKSQ